MYIYKKQTYHNFTFCFFMIDGNKWQINLSSQQSVTVSVHRNAHVCQIRTNTEQSSKRQMWKQHQNPPAVTGIICKEWGKNSVLSWGGRLKQFPLSHTYQNHVFLEVRWSGCPLQSSDGFSCHSPAQWKAQVCDGQHSSGFCQRLKLHQFWNLLRQIKSNLWKTFHATI